MHNEKHFNQSAFVRDIVIGLSDGLTVPFALAAGLSSALANSSMGNSIIITAGVAEIIAGSIAMGLGGYLAGRTEIDHYNAELDREYREIKEFNDVERQEVKDIFAQYGLSAESQEVIINEMVKDEDKWVDFMMRYELGLEKPDADRAKKSAFNIGGAYIVGGVIPLMGYVCTHTPKDGLLYSSIITVLCLLVFGFLKSKVTGQNPWIGAIKVTSIGVIAATAAYFIAKFVSNM
jgi:VIT1/CCC1 family predicted Fe2+/Mn2+ transporter